MAANIGKLGPNWRQQILEGWNIQSIEIDSSLTSNTLWTTRCCKIKTTNSAGTPGEMYRAPLPQRFMARMRELGNQYAIISDLYGLHFAGDEKAPYDLHPSQLSKSSRSKLGRLIASQFRNTDFEILVFFNDSPVFSRPYFEILSASGLPVYFTTRLP